MREITARQVAEVVRELVAQPARLPTSSR